MLYCQVKIIQRLTNCALAVSILPDRRTTDIRGHHIVVCDIAAGATREPISLFDNTIVGFEERYNILYSATHVVKVMGTGYPTRCILDSAFDSSRKLAVWASI